MEELLNQFPGKLTVEPLYRSFIYQPERVSINSRRSLLQSTNQIINYPDFYYQFQSELKTPLLRIKKMELLRATIPNAVTNIPWSQGVFFYYKIPTIGAFADYEPDYSLLDPYHIHMVRLLPQPEYDPDDFFAPQQYAYNRTFEDYQDLTNELELATLDDPDFNYPDWQPNTPYPANTYRFRNTTLWYSQNGSAGTAVFNTDGAWVANQITPFIAEDITFGFDSRLNKIVFNGNNYESAGVPFDYYLPVGYADPNLQIFIDECVRRTSTQKFPTNVPYTLNRRLGFVWSGVDPNIAGDEDVEILVQHTIPKPNWNMGTNAYDPLLPNYTAESYPDLINTQNVFIYCDFVGGSTQDTNADERLLAVVPMAASNLGTGFGESKISCPLTKVSDAIYRILITLRTDTAEPFYLPTNAYVNLEIKLEYE